MNANVEYKLINLVSEFKGQTLKDMVLKEKELDGNKHLILELGFHDSAGERTVMALVLDQTVTLSNSGELYEQLVK